MRDLNRAWLNTVVRKAQPLLCFYIFVASIRPPRIANIEYCINLLSSMWREAGLFIRGPHSLRPLNRGFQSVTGSTQFKALFAASRL